MGIRNVKNDSIIKLNAAIGELLLNQLIYKLIVNALRQTLTACPSKSFFTPIHFKQ